MNKKIALEAEEAQQMQTQPSRVSQSFARGALEHLCPVLLQNLAKQDEEIDNQDWTVPAAASVCLMHLARCCGDVMLPHVIPYVAAHIQHQDWHLREAAVMAFGQCLEVTDSTDMPAYTAQILPVLLQLTSDSVLKVSDTAAWALGQICESVPQVVTTPEHLSMTVPVLLELLTSHPNIAGYAAWGLGSLCEATYEAALEALCEEAYNDEDIVVQDFAFSEVYERMVGALFATADRPDSGEFNLSTAVFEAIMTVIQHSAANCYPTIRQACEAVLERLENCVVQATQVIGHDDHMRLATFQGQLCATLQIILGKLSKEDALAVSDRVMTLLLSMFQTTSAKGHVEEDALLAITALINALEHDFIKYMDAFKPYLVLGLKNHQAHQVCSLAVGLVGDICRALGPDVVNYCEEFMRLLLDDVADPRLHRSVKPPILSAFGDIALAIGTLFQGNYLDVTMTVLQQASIVQAPDAMDYDTIEYLNRLRSACLEAYTSIVQGLKGVGNTPQPEVQVLLPYLTHMVKFVEFVAQDREHSEDVVQGALGLIGDLAESFGVTMQRYVDQNVMGAFLKQSRLSSSSQTTRLAEWATRTITKCLA